MTQPNRVTSRRRLAIPLLTMVMAAIASPAYAQDAVEAGASPTAVESVAPGEASSSGTVDGTWTIDTAIGDFADFSSAWVGFRVNEVLQNIGEAQAVGRTPIVSGELTVLGTVIESARIEADLTAIRSDQSRRDPAIQRALETADFPTATFESSQPVDLGMIPAENEPFAVAMPGTLTIHGVSQDVTLELQAQRVGDVVAVVGTLPIDFTSYGVTMPTAPIVISVEDTGELEWLLFFRRQG